MLPGDKGVWPWDGQFAQLLKSILSTDGRL